MLRLGLTGGIASGKSAVAAMLRELGFAVLDADSLAHRLIEPGQPAYGASKAGLNSLTQSLALALGNHGIAVTAVAPGYVETALTDVLPEDVRGMILANTPLGRLGRPEDVAGAVRFLCSDEASFITGEVLLVDGGLGM